MEKLKGSMPHRVIGGTTADLEGDSRRESERRDTGGVETIMWETVA